MRLTLLGKFASPSALTRALVEAGTFRICHVSNREPFLEHSPLQILIIYLASGKPLREKLRENKRLRKATASLNIPYEEMNILPFTTLYNKYNPLMKSSFLGAVLIAVPTVIGRLIYDIFVIGAPKNFADTAWIIVYYAADIFGIFISYLIIIFAINT